MKQKDNQQSYTNLGKEATQRISDKGIPCICEVYNYDNRKAEVVLAVETNGLFEKAERIGNLDHALGLPILYRTSMDLSRNQFISRLKTNEGMLLRDWDWARSDEVCDSTKLSLTEADLAFAEDTEKLEV